MAWTADVACVPCGEKGHGIFACRAVAIGSPVLRLDGPQNLEIGTEPCAIAQWLGDMEVPARLLNHACDPTCSLTWRRGVLEALHDFGVLDLVLFL